VRVIIPHFLLNFGIVFGSFAYRDSCACCIIAPDINPYIDGVFCTCNQFPQKLKITRASFDEFYPVAYRIGIVVFPHEYFNRDENKGEQKIIY
jgi:hypothetical protein